MEELLKKVSSLYNRYGIKSITMDDVARELGISKKTLYQYVSDKTELVEKVVRMEMEKKEHDFQEISERSVNAIEELYEMHRQLNDMMKEVNPSREYDLQKYYPGIFRELLNARNESMIRCLVENMNRGKKQGLYRAELNIQMIARMYLMRVENMAHYGPTEVQAFTSMEFFREVFIYHVRGIANEKGIAFLNEYINKLDQNKSNHHA